MAWTYLAASAESQRPSKGMLPQSPIVKLIDMQGVSSYRECPTEVCPSLLFGTMFPLCTEDCCRRLILSMEVSPAKISASPPNIRRLMEQVWTESEAVYSAKSNGLLAKLRPNGCSSKIPRIYALTDLAESSKAWTASGTMLDGVCSALPILVPFIREKGGFYWPTPATRDYRDYGLKPGQKSLETTMKRNSPSAFAVAINHYQKTFTPGLYEWLMTYPMGWTECEPWAIPLSRRKRGKRSND